jgi:hypothetical protein
MHKAGMQVSIKCLSVYCHIKRNMSLIMSGEFVRKIQAF